MSKKTLIIVGSGLLLSVIVYSSVTSMSKSNNGHINGYEHYYNEDDTSVRDSATNTGDISVLAHDTDATALKVIENAPIDTNPESIGVFVNKEYALPDNYVPSDLTEIGRAHV